MKILCQRLLLLSLLAPGSAWAQPYPKANSFFEHDYLNKGRQEESSSGSARSAESDEDSWVAPSKAIRGGDVAGSDRVRDYREKRGQFADSSTSAASGYTTIPLGNGAAIVLPDAQGGGASDRD